MSSLFLRWIITLRWLCVCEDNWMLLEYEGGENYGTHCGNEGKRTMVMIMCKSGETTVFSPPVRRLIDKYKHGKKTAIKVARGFYSAVFIKCTESIAVMFKCQILLMHYFKELSYLSIEINKVWKKVFCNVSFLYWLISPRINDCIL